jgi:hypothetical protein
MKIENIEWQVICDFQVEIPGLIYLLRCEFPTDYLLVARDGRYRHFQTSGEANRNRLRLLHSEGVGSEIYGPLYKT